MKYVTILALLILIITVQCSSRDETNLDPTITKLLGTWRLIEPDSSYSTTLQFAFDTDHPPIDITPFKASGTASVNQYTIRMYATVDGMMSADHLSSTKMSGSPQAMQVEQSYLTRLEDVVRYEMITQHRLRLHCGGENPGILVFEKTN